ncbi:anti-repressor SinI family protein [Bacillus sp. NTK071]|uniref:anti-repressor SinI family protein n=1 Tax=Bacillus sp. NTK071 TaxID=2802175 RepID=UPI001A8FC85B|nr:anti-repressor SinI family protein [Bacillus sp. NTK071]MBN8207690.1 anti-repressor SinI family protein [Bacillus sp. NTK071]
MAVAKIMSTKVLDQEWVVLMRAARELGLQKNEIQAFLRQYNKPTTTRLHK